MGTLAITNEIYNSPYNVTCWDNTKYCVAAQGEGISDDTVSEIKDVLSTNVSRTVTLPYAKTIRFNISNNVMPINLGLSRIILNCKIKKQTELIVIIAIFSIAFSSLFSFSAFLTASFQPLQ